MKIEIYIPPSILWPHREGGWIVTSAPNVQCDLSRQLVAHGEDGQRSDVIAITRQIADDEGRVHRLVTHVSSYDLWHVLAGGLCYTMDAFLASWMHKPGVQLTPLLSGLHLWSDGRDDRHIPIYDGSETRVCVVREKYYSASIELLAQSVPDNQQNRTYANYVTLLWRSDVESPFLGATQSRVVFPIVRRVHWDEIMWLNPQHPACEDGVEQWVHSPVPLPMLFESTNERGTPNPNIRWVR